MMRGTSKEFAVQFPHSSRKETETEMTCRWSHSMALTMVQESST